MSTELIFDRTIAFLNQIGLCVVVEKLKEFELKQCFLPKVLLAAGQLKIDPSAHVGDILHEAGHLAIFPARLRHLLNNNTISAGDLLVDAARNSGIVITQAELDILQYCYDDQAPQGWQYAANVHLGLDTKTGFELRFAGQDGKYVHDSIRVSLGSFMGHRVSVTLYYLGMTRSKAEYPKMVKWVND